MPTAPASSRMNLASSEPSRKLSGSGGGAELLDREERLDHLDRVVHPDGHNDHRLRDRPRAARRLTRSARSIELPVAAGSGRSSASAGASGARTAPRRSSSAEREPRGPAAGEIRDQRPARSTLPEPPGPTSTSSRVAQPGQQCSTRSKRSYAGRLDRHVPLRYRRSERPCLRVTARFHPRALGPPEYVVPDRYAQIAARTAFRPPAATAARRPMSGVSASRRRGRQPLAA